MFHCLHPVTVPDSRKPGTFRKVPCGKCEACLSARSYSWSRRINVEASQHKYVFFVTLTYSDDFVPVFYPEDALYYQFVTDRQRSDILDYLSENEVSEKYLVLRYNDVQNFLKRLRNYVYDCKHIPTEQKMFRFYCCGEYGPTTLRPHYHLLFFLDSDYLGEPRGKRGLCRFFSLVRKAWSVPSEDNKYRIPIGRVDHQYVRDSAASYCSSYVTSFSYIPALLRCSAFKPFCHASKAPPLGSFKFDVSQARAIVVGGYNELTNFSGCEADGNVTIPLFKSLKDRLFPRVTSYSLLSDVGRFALYGCARFPYVGSSYSEFREYLYDNPDHYLSKLILNVIDAGSFGELYQLNPKANKSLVRIWRISNSVLTNCSLFGISLSDYVGFIDKFYSNQDYNALKSQLEFEVDISNVVSDDIRLLPSFIDESVFGYDYVWSRECLKSFGIESRFDYDKYQFVRSFYFKNYASSVISRVQVGKSYKAKSDYVMHGQLSNLNVL